MNDEQWEKLQARREQAAYFAGLELAAQASQKVAVKVKLPKPPKEKKPRDPRERKPRSDARPPNCIECGWALRGRGRDADHPGTRRHESRGRCAVCVREGKRDGKPGRRILHDGTTSCSSCSVTLSPSTVGKSLPDGWLCRPCARRARRDAVGLPKRTRPEACKGCDRPLRASDALASEFPGTMRHIGNGMCGACTSAERRRKAGILPKKGRLDDSTPSTCRHCSVSMVSRGSSPTPEQRKHVGRGLCSRCYESERRR